MSNNPSLNAPFMASFLSELHRLNSSELMHLFTVNLPYNDLQRSSLDATKACCTSDITLLYASLDECKRLHSKLQMELQAAKLDVDSIKAVTHPVHLMPPKLLQEIFKYGRKNRVNTCISPIGKLWRCAQVCQ